MSMATDKPDAQAVKLIKQSIALRAKYRKGQGPAPCIKLLAPALAVPHHKNRGGDPVVSMRTRELGNFIAREGNDPMEAASSAVAVEGHAGKTAADGDFQSHFEGQVAKKDPDMAARVIKRHQRRHWHFVSRPLELFGSQHYSREKRLRVRQEPW